MATIAELEAELIAKVQEVSVFSERGYSIHNLDELGELADDGVGFPMAGVAYLRTGPRENAGVTARGQGADPKDVMMVDMQFAILVCVEYNWSDGENTKPVATDLLDSVRGKLLGFRGVSRRPWRLIDEGPTDSNINGVIMYSQVWETTSVTKGNSA